MMTLDEAREHVGDPVQYRPVGGKPENGVITSVGGGWAYVRYDGGTHSKATHPAQLTLLTSGGGEPDAR